MFALTTRRLHKGREHTTRARNGINYMSPTLGSHRNKHPSSSPFTFEFVRASGSCHSPDDDLTTRLRCFHTSNHRQLVTAYLESSQLSPAVAGLVAAVQTLALRLVPLRWTRHSRVNRSFDVVVCHLWTSSCIYSPNSCLALALALVLSLSSYLRPIHIQ